MSALLSGWGWAAHHAVQLAPQQGQVARSSGELRVADRSFRRRRRAQSGGPERPSVASDLLELTKPTITAMSVLMTAGGLLLAPGQPSLILMLWALLGTGLAVGSANALNMYLERDGDRLMNRTKRRPLPDGRLDPKAALGFGLALGAASVMCLWSQVNGLTAWLGVFALTSYVCVYTPLKRRSPIALLIGAVPGAMPPLMGWTAATGRIEWPGIVLFATLLLWQLPHFLAIAIYSKDDYARAGIRTVPVVRGDRMAKLQALAYATLLVPVSLMLVPAQVAGEIYLLVAAGVGAWFWWIAVKGLRADAGAQWARRLFMASLVYLPAVTLALAVDKLLL